MLHKFIYNLGLFFRNRKIKPSLAFLLESQYWSIEKIEAYQYSRLKDLLASAVTGSPYYAELLMSKEGNLGNITSLEDLAQLPTTSKAKLLENTKKIQSSIVTERLYYSETSGSTGKPLVFYRNQSWDAWHNASVFRGYSWHGIQPWDRNGYLWGYNLSPKEALKTRILDALQNRFRLFSYDQRDIERFCEKLKAAKYLNGYSSMIYELAKQVNKQDMLKDSINLTLVKGTSEKIYDSYQDVAKSAFNKKIVSEYGAAEAGIIAFECNEGNMHINMETVIVEEVKGQIVVTNLVSHSFPIIRYELGDHIVLDKKTKCSCGRHSHILKEVTGRVGKNIYGVNGTYPSLTLYYIFKNIAINHNRILNYQGVQTKEGCITLRIEQSLTALDQQLIETEMLKYFNEDLALTLIDNQKLVSGSGKTKDFISDIH